MNLAPQALQKPKDKQGKEDRIIVDKRWKEKKINPMDFHEARNGDHALTPFECDFCIFRKLKGRNPNQDNHQDKLLLVHIRRMNLDAFWARARSTVKENSNRIKQSLKFSQTLGLTGPYEHKGPYPLHDHCGYEVALVTLMHSRRPGKNDKRHTQFDTIRKLRTSYSSQIKAAPQSNMKHIALADTRGKHIRLVQDKCSSLWFNRFMTGVKARMGSTWKPNKALSHALILLVISKVEEKIVISEESTEKDLWLVFSTYVTISYVLSLRGNEGVMLEISGLRKHWKGEEVNYLL